MTESWDSDPDLVLPDGPLTLLHSDTEAEAETSTSSVSALFSTSRQSSHTADEDEDEDDDDWPSHPTTDESDNPKDGTLKALAPGLASVFKQPPAPDPHHLLSSSGEDREEGAEDSFSSNSSSERQSTIKATLAPQTPHHLTSTHTPSRLQLNPSHRIDPTVLSVLASGAKGTVTKLEPHKKASPVQAGIDWDEDLILPDTGLVPRNIDKTAVVLRTKASFASGISDELDELASLPDDEFDDHQSTKPPMASSSSRLPSAQVHHAFSKLIPASSERDDFTDDFDLPSSVQHLEFNPGNRTRKPTTTTVSSSSSSSSSLSSLAALTESEPDPLTHHTKAGPHRKHKRTPKAGPSHLSSSNDTPRVRNRPSLTPSLMSDRSSSPFTEAEDDPNEGLLDDIEFPPEFGITNNISSASSATPTPSTSKMLTLDRTTHQTSTLNLQGLLDRKMKARAAVLERPNQNPGLIPSSGASYDTLQSFPSSSGVMSFRSAGSQLSSQSQSSSSTSVYHRGLSSFTSQNMRRAFRAFEEHQDERVEDGLEIDVGSLRSERLRSRTSSSISSASSPPPILTGAFHRRGIGSAGGSGSSTPSSQHQSAIYQQKRMTVPFPSSTASSLMAASSPEIKHTKASYMRSISTNSIDLNPIHASSSTSRFPQVSLAYRPSSTSSTTQARASPILVTPRPTSVVLLPSTSGTTSPSADSLSAPRFRTKSLRPSPSNGDLNGEASRPVASTSSTASHRSAVTERVRSPLGYAVSHPKPTSSHKLPNNAASRARTSTDPRSTTCSPQPGLSATGLRVLKHKKSAALLKIGTGANAIPLGRSSHEVSSVRPPPQSSSTSLGSLATRMLARKSSMPSLSSEFSNGPEHPSRTLSQKTSGGSRPSSRSQDHHPPPTSYVAPPGSATSNASTASSTVSAQSRADLFGRQYSSTSTPLATIAASPDRTLTTKDTNSTSHSLPGRRLSSATDLTQSRPHTPQQGRISSPSPGPIAGITITTIMGVNSRLTMPTIASRLKAKPSIIHEEHHHHPACATLPPTSARLKHSNSRAGPNGLIGGPVSHHLRRPKKPRQYGDGTELDEFDDLPTSKEKERLFTTVKTQLKPLAGTSAARHQSGARSSPLGSTSELGARQAAATRASAARQREATTTVHGRLEARKAEGARRRAAAMGNSKLSASKKGLIRQMSVNTLAKSSMHSEMRWNERESRWEGNEQVLRDFDNVLSSSSRPALITQLSTQSPHHPHHHSKHKMPHADCQTNKAHNHTVGEMVFDSVAMCWRSRAPEAEVQLQLEIEDGFWDVEEEEAEERLEGRTTRKGPEWMSQTLASHASYPISVQRAIYYLPPSPPDAEKNIKEGDEPDTGKPWGCGLRQTEDVVRFWETACEAEARHRNEVCAWVKRRKAKEGRSYLKEIRKLVIDLGE